MNDNPSYPAEVQPDFQVLFESVPECLLVLAPDPPRFTILAASTAYLHATRTRREEIVGRSVFEVFPENPDDPAGAERNSRASFERVLRRRVPDAQALQQHDLRRPQSEGGGFEPRFWIPLNTPVLDAQGRVLYLIHRVEDVTEWVLAGQPGSVPARLKRDQGAPAEALLDAARIRREANAARDREERLQRFFDSGLLGVIFWNMDGTITDANHKFLEMTGYSRDELVSGRLDWVRLTPPEYRPQDEASIRELKATGLNRQPFEKEYLRKDGSRIPVLIAGAMLDETRFNGVAFVLDITERKQAENALRQTAAKLQAMNVELRESDRAMLSLMEDADLARTRAEQAAAELQSANAELRDSHHAAINLMDDALRARQRAEEINIKLSYEAEQRRLSLEAGDLGAWDYHFTTGEVFWDARCRALWGLPAHEHIDYTAAIDRIIDEDRPGVDAAVRAALEGAEGGAYHREFRVVWPDGSVHWVASHGRVYFAGDGPDRHPIRFVGVLRDITVEKLTEDTLRFLVEGGTLAVGEDFFQALARYLTRCLSVNFVCIDRLEKDLLTAKTVAVFSDGQFEDNLSYTLKDTPCGEVVGKAVCCFPQQVCQLFPNDAVLRELRAESYLGTTLWDSDGKPIGLIAVIGRQPLADQDLAKSILQLVSVRAAAELQRRQADEALRRTTTELQRSNRDLEQFAYVASHDLQEPLRAVAGYVDLLESHLSGQLDEKGRGYVSHAKEGAMRMQALILDLLQFSRVGTRRGALVAADLNTLLVEALRNLDASIRNSGAQITHEALPTVPADAFQIRQLFQNLVGNAIKFCRAQPPQIRVRALRLEEGWQLSVQDNGIGIDPKFFDRIFQIFQRLHTRAAYPGTGIGLAICKKIVERHNGRIWVESVLGQGSTFHFILPDKHSDTADAASSTATNGA